MASAPCVTLEDSWTDVSLRIVREFVGAPLLALTLPQMRRLWALDEGECREILGRLLVTGSLALRDDGRYVLASPRT
jgi:hypothetical protein